LYYGPVGLAVQGLSKKQGGIFDKKRWNPRLSHTRFYAENTSIIYDDGAGLEIEDQKAHARHSGFTVFFARSKTL
jgi:hypothetical protein